MSCPGHKICTNFSVLPLFGWIFCLIFERVCSTSPELLTQNQQILVRKALCTWPLQKDAWGFLVLQDHCCQKLRICCYLSLVDTVAFGVGCVMRLGIPILTCASVIILD